MAEFLESLMILRKSLVVGLLSVSALMVAALPGMARPGTIDIEANVRADASFQAEVLDGLPVGTSVEVLKVVTEPTRGDYWYYLRSTGKLKTQGWVRSNLVRFEPSDKSYGTLGGEPGDVINIRSAPSTQGEVLHTGVLGDLVMVGRSKFVPLGNDYGRTGHRWHYVTYPSGAAGWVRGDLISVWPKGCIITCPET
jgi:Bacterial SH3 domain